MDSKSVTEVIRLPRLPPPTQQPIGGLLPGEATQGPGLKMPGTESREPLPRMEFGELDPALFSFSPHRRWEQSGILSVQEERPKDVDIGDSLT